MRWHSYRARWRGAEYDASPDVRAGRLWIRLRRATPAEGFEEVAPGRYVRPVPAEECEAVVFVTTVGTWRGVPCQVHDARDGHTGERPGGDAGEPADGDLGGPVSEPAGGHLDRHLGGHLGGHCGELLVEYTGGLAPVARALGLPRAERGVYRGWVRRDEVLGLREHVVPLDM
ncbi:hypothetical protein [Sphaerisporangium album]|uniref:hypothetical protein n=1 Tax=Sphaerisporangium album TaxID=509200 RepID=UPI0015F08CD5|nr:hypothetical protein [Sphaerisporangium album]